MRITIVLVFVSIILAQTWAVAIEGSEEEGMSIDKLFKAWGKMMNEETYDKMIPELYEQNATLMVNGHMPVQGIIGKQQ